MWFSFLFLPDFLCIIPPRVVNLDLSFYFHLFIYISNAELVFSPFPFLFYFLLILFTFRKWRESTGAIYAWTKKTMRKSTSRIILKNIWRTNMVKIRGNVKFASMGSAPVRSSTRIKKPFIIKLIVWFLAFYFMYLRMYYLFMFYFCFRWYR